MTWRAYVRARPWAYRTVCVFVLLVAVPSHALRAFCYEWEDFVETVGTAWKGLRRGKP